MKRRGFIKFLTALVPGSIAAKAVAEKTDWIPKPREPIVPAPAKTEQIVGIDEGVINVSMWGSRGATVTMMGNCMTISSPAKDFIPAKYFMQDKK